VERVKAGLARVSTEKQGYQIALTNQIQRLRDWGCDRIYAGIASRTDENRADVEALIKAIESGEIESVTVTVLDRATASPALFDRLTNILQRHNVPLIGIDASIDITSEGGEFMAGMEVLISKTEVKKIRGRAQRGYESKRRNNRPNNNPPFGYAVRDRKYVFDNQPHLYLMDGTVWSKADLARETIATFQRTQSISATIREIHEKFGVNFRSKARSAPASSAFVLEPEDDLSAIKGAGMVGRHMFRWTHAGLRNWLVNPVLRGHTAYGRFVSEGLDECGRRKFGKAILDQSLWDIRRDTHPESAMLTELEYEAIEQILSINARSRANTIAWIEKGQLRYPISGLVYCGECGGKFSARGTKRHGAERRIYYQCQNYVRADCPEGKMIRSDRVEASIVQALIDAAAIVNAEAQKDSEKKHIPSSELNALREQLTGLKSLGANPAIAAAIEEIQSQIHQIEFTESARSQTKERTQEDLQLIFENRDYWEVALKNVEERTRVFNHFIDRVIIRCGAIVEVRLKF
jgi:DNA invertase Pin-like site-specific DNA recombinase